MFPQKPQIILFFKIAKMYQRKPNIFCPVPQICGRGAARTAVLAMRVEKQKIGGGGGMGHMGH